MSPTAQRRRCRSEIPLGDAAPLGDARPYREHISTSEFPTMARPPRSLSRRAPPSARAWRDDRFSQLALLVIVSIRKVLQLFVSAKRSNLALFPCPQRRLTTLRQREKEQSSPGFFGKISKLVRTLKYKKPLPTCLEFYY